MTQQSLQLAGQHLQAGRLAEAEAIYRRILAKEPRNADALHMLGMVHFKNRLADEAIDPIRQAIRIDPKRPDFHFNLGAVLASLSRDAEAIESYQRALSLRADYPQALNNLGNSLRRTGNFDEAAQVLRRAIVLRPDYFEAHSNLGKALAAAKNYPGAVDSFRAALALRPSAESFNNLATALFDSRQLDPAVDAFREALKLKPDYPQARRGLADALAARGDLEEAIEIYRAILATHPLAEDDILFLLANALKNYAKMDEADAAYRKALKLNPSNVIARSNLAFSLWYHSGYDSAAILQEHRRWDRLFAQPLRAFNQPHANNRDPGRRLKIGYASPDFRQHATSFCTVPLLSHHDHRQFEIYCYASIERPDAVTDRLKSCADVWRDGLKLSDEQLADLIRSDEIDILMDMSMHTSDHRLLTFARKPAPVQVTWIAVPGTTGLQTIDYRLTDPHLDPPGTDHNYSEKSIRLPDSFWCYDPLTDNPPPVGPLPALENGFVTFGCLNKFCKVNDGVLALWSRVLKAIPTSRMILHCPPGSARQWALAGLDVDPQRIQLVNRQTRQLYMETYHRIDLCLDTLPYNGHMTSLDAFWMGVPVLSLLGKTVVGRAGLSLLTNLGLTEMSAKSEEEFIRIAADWAGDLQRLANLRATLRTRLEKSPLMDGPRMTRNVEAIYREIWRRWCAEANSRTEGP